MKNLIFDVSPIAYRYLFGMKDDIKMLGINVLRSFLLGNILTSIERFNPNKVYVCFDCKGGYWREEHYSLYKAHRAALREKQDIDWKEFYGFLDSFYTEMKDNFPVVALRHNKLEADDIAAHLVRRFSNDNNIIITNDEDYLQLLKYKNVEVFNSKTNKKMLCESPKRFLEAKIIQGDTGDNIPAIRARIGPATAEKLVEDDKFYVELEQKDPDGKPCELRRNYDRNKLLIDLENTPEALLMSLENLIDDYVMVDTRKLTTYIRDFKLRDLFDRISSIRRNLNKLVTTSDNQLVQPL